MSAVAIILAVGVVLNSVAIWMLSRAVRTRVEELETRATRLDSIHFSPEE